MGAWSQSSRGARENPRHGDPPGRAGTTSMRVCELLARRSRAALGGARTCARARARRVGAAGFEVGRDNWVAARTGELVGYAAVSRPPSSSSRDGDPTAGDALLGGRVARARERGLDGDPRHRSAGGRAGSRAPRRSAHGFELETVAIRHVEALDGADRSEPAVLRRSRSGRMSRRCRGTSSSCSTRPMPLGRALRADRRDDDWVDWMTGDAEFDPAVWWLAERDGELAGCALALGERLAEGPRRARARERGRGLGTALVQQRPRRVRPARSSRASGSRSTPRNPTGAVAALRAARVRRSNAGRRMWTLSL